MYSGFETETKPSNLQPFQWPVPENMEVVTRSGEKVTQLTKFDTVSHLSLRGVLDKSIESWVENGKWNQVDAHSDYDLFLRPIPRERWVMINHRTEKAVPSLLTEAEYTSMVEHTPIDYSIHKITLP